MSQKCTNCHGALAQPQVFQGVVICDDCFAIVSHAIKRAREQMQMVFLTYTDALRVALIRGELRPPVLPGGDVPISELREAFKKVREQHAAARTTSGSGVSGMRGAAEDPDAKLPGGGGD